MCRDIVIPLRSRVDTFVKPYPVAVPLQQPENGKNFILVFVGIAGENIGGIAGIRYDRRNLLPHLFRFRQIFLNRSKDAFRRYGVQFKRKLKKPAFFCFMQLFGQPERAPGSL